MPSRLLGMRSPKRKAKPVRSSVQIRESGRAGVFLAAALAVLALIACALAPSARAESFEFGSGHLDWGVKESFRKYIEGPIAHGTLAASEGATRNGEVIEFPVHAGSLDDATGVGEIAASGSVRFSGHDGTLDMTISNPVFAFDEDSGVLRAHIGSKQLSGGVICGAVELAEFDLSGTPDPVGAPFELQTLEGDLTTAGVPVFGSFYEAGDPMDAVSIAATVGAPSPSPSPPPCPTEDPGDPGDPTDPGTSDPTPGGGGQSTAPQPTTQPATQNSVQKPKSKRCKKGFRKVKAKGKTRCVKKKKQQGKKAKRKAAKRP